MSPDDIHLPSVLSSHAAQEFPWDILVLAILAGALAFRLYRVLGRRVGIQGVRQERGPQGIRRKDVGQPLTPPPFPGKDGAPVAGSSSFGGVEHDIPAPATRVGGILEQMGRLEAGVTPQAFMSEAESMFRQIVPAFAAGDRAALSGLLVPETETAFLEAIEARNAAGETQRSDLRGIDSMAIQDAVLVSGEAGGQVGRIELKIVSRQISLLTDRAGEPLQGTEAVTEFHDLWLFERAFGVSGARWRLAASRPA